MSHRADDAASADIPHGEVTVLIGQHGGTVGGKDQRYAGSEYTDHHGGRKIQTADGGQFHHGSCPAGAKMRQSVLSASNAD